MTSVRIRDAEIADLDTITEIHNHAVLHTTAIWDEDETDVAERTTWFADRLASGYPVIVAVDESGVLGYASYGRWRPRTGYRLSVEHSVYVLDGQHGRGIGTMLMDELLTRARAAGMHAMVAGIESGNTASIALHKRLGFVEVGRMPQVGAKFGRWLDLSMLQLLLDDHTEPAPRP